MKKVFMLNKNILHLINDIFWNMVFKTETQGIWDSNLKTETQADKVIPMKHIIPLYALFLLYQFINYTYYIYYKHYLQVRQDLGLADHV